MSILQTIRHQQWYRQQCKSGNLGVILFGTKQRVKAKGLLWQLYRKDSKQVSLHWRPMVRHAHQSAKNKTPAALLRRVQWLRGDPC